jgi:hypothetical protein
MPENEAPVSQHHRNLALAIIQALQVWSNERYRPFLLGHKPAGLTEEWFRWFTGEWNVARTIKTGRRASVRRYLDVEFRDALSQGGGSDAVDDAASHIQHKGWSANGALPISIVSKIGFFLCPSELVPMDRYAKQGLDNLRSGETRLGRCSYCDYLSAFNEQYALMESQLKNALKEPWVIALADKLGCPAAALKRTAIRRKVFDNYLMHSGDYLQ